MPRNLPQYTHCAAPGDAYPISAGSIAVMTFSAAVYGFLGGLTFTLVMALMGTIATAGCIVGVGVYTLLVAGLLEFKDWYYNYRLMCIQHDRCAAGTIVGQPHESTDGDRKFEILIAPFDVPETEQLLIQVLVDLGAAGQLTNVPDAIDLQNRQVRFGYMRGLSESEQIKVHLELVDNRMFSQPGRGYLRHFYRRDEAIMGTAAFSNSPDDTITAANPNPMFRINPQEGEDPEENVLVPYMHCELEGNRLALWLDNVLVGLIAGFAAFVALCAICEFFTLGAADFLCGWIGAAGSLLIALLAWLVSHLFNDPDDGVAGPIDVDVEDPDFDTPPTTARHGDVAYLFGDWVMDEEHGKYFEIHPIKAYYLLCRGGDNPDDWVLTEEVRASECAFDVRRLTGEDFERICKIVRAVEQTDPDDKFTINLRRALSMAKP